MASENEGRAPKGRDYNRVTKGGSNSAGSMGSGGTGDIGSVCGNRGADTARNAQSDTRTDDLMSTDSEKEQRQGFRPSAPEALETGMEGMGNRSGNKAGNQ